MIVLTRLVWLFFLPSALVAMAILVICALVLGVFVFFSYLLSKLFF